MKKALKWAFTREGSSLNSDSDKLRVERSEFGLDEHGDLKKKQWEGVEETVRNDEEILKMNTGLRKHAQMKGDETSELL